MKRKKRMKKTYFFYILIVVVVGTLMFQQYEWEVILPERISKNPSTANGVKLFFSLFFAVGIVGLLEKLMDSRKNKKRYNESIK